VEHAAFRNPLEGIEGTIMKEKPAPKTTNEVFTPIRDLPSAPIIFFEFCPTLGNHNGLINIMLAVRRTHHGCRSRRGGSSALHGRSRHSIARRHRQGAVDRRAGSKP
jgi:hypothetical protein